MRTIYLPKTERAKKLFTEYAKESIKVGKIGEESIWFINYDCDLTTNKTYQETFKFGFWIDKQDLLITDRPGKI